ncbi:glycosyltransferase family 4 protein [bacterium]|nr:glycosyltransferase family 4 protein [bacterium]
MKIPRRLKIAIAYIPLKIWYWLQHRQRYMQQVQPLRRWSRILIGGTPKLPKISVFYGHEHVPRTGEIAHGGIVKFQRMQANFPNSPYRFNILYMVSSRKPQDAGQLLWLARRKGAKFVWNQNGVAYPGWHGEGWQQSNQPLATLLHAADYVFYQSQFCKLSADRFLGQRKCNYEILYNCVDTSTFTPNSSPPTPDHLVLLLGGSQYQYYRLEAALKTIAILSRDRPNNHLLITGKLSWLPDEAEAKRIAQGITSELGIGDHVTFLGGYTQHEAPTLYRQAHILLHTKYNDPCPGLIVEAMACGLPVVYSASGGVPELVGTEAGIGVPAPLSWEQDFPPNPEALAAAVLQVAARHRHYAEAARTRAVEKFDLRPWLQRHCEVFTTLLS